MPARRPRRLSCLLALAVLGLGGGLADTALARQRSGKAAAPSEPAAQVPSSGAVVKEAPRPPEPQRPLTCRQYVPAARTTVAVACPDGPDPPATAPPASAQPATGTSAPKPAPSPARAATRIADDAKGCRRYLPSIGTTLAVACEDAPSSDGAPAAAADPAPLPVEPPRPPEDSPAPSVPKRPYIMADNTAGQPGAVDRRADDGRCRDAIVRAGLGTVASGNLAELRRGC